MSDNLLPFPRPWVQTDVLGRTRLTRKVYAGGEYECAFCYCAVTGAQCDNPACMTRATYPIERAREIVAHSEMVRETEARRAREREFSAEYARERTIEKARAAAALEAQCKREGKCIHCARAGKLVRHRGNCPRLR